MDADYLSELSEEDRAWYEDFCRKYYGADFRGDEDWSQEERREAYTDRNRANADAVTTPVQLDSGAWVQSTVSKNGICVADCSDRDWSTTPDYLDQEDYKDARGAFRDTLHKGRGARRPDKTSEHLRRKARLMALLGKETKADD